MKRDQTLHGKNVFYSLLFPNQNTLMTVYLLMTRGSSGDETEAQKHPQASRTSLSLLKSHSSDKKKTYFSKNLMTQSTTSTHTNRRSVRKKPLPKTSCTMLFGSNNLYPPSEMPTLPSRKDRLHFSFAFD